MRTNAFSEPPWPGTVRLFAREDYVEEAWRIVEPVLKGNTPVYQYAPHTWGPEEVERVTPPGGWSNPGEETEYSQWQVRRRDENIEVYARRRICGSNEAAKLIAKEARERSRLAAEFVMAVSGGKTPWIMLRDLAHEDVPWNGVHVVQVDERVAPAGDPDRNLTHLRESLLRACAAAP